MSPSAEAKKKKPAKKHNKDARRQRGKSKSSDRGLPPPEPGPESDEASTDAERPPGRRRAGESEEKQAKAPPPAPEPEEKRRPRSRPQEGEAPRPPPRERRAADPIALPLGVGGKALFRKLTWTDSGNLPGSRPTPLSPGPEVALWLEAFPLAFITDGFAANIGLYGNFDYGLGASSNRDDGTKLTTKYQDFLAGLKVRIPIGSFIPYLAGGYGMQKFSLEPAAPDRPNFNYAFVTAGGGARIQFTPALDLDLGAGFLYVLNPGKAAGEVGAIYPTSTANGVDVTLSVGFRLVSMVGIRVGGDFRQFGLATHWKTGDTSLQAGGALDRNISVWGGLELVFDGVGGAGGHEEEGETPAAKKPPPKKAAPREIEPEETDKPDTEE